MASLTESELPQAGRTLRWRLASDQVLSRAAASGAEGAFDEIFSRYQPALVRHCRAVLLDADEAQDAAQNALTSALRALRRGTSQPVSLKAWLYRIAHNEAIALARRRADQQARRAPDDGVEVELLAVSDPADDDTRERVQELVRDLRDLPERQRNALLLRELSGLAYNEVGAVLGTSAGAAKQTVFEARAALIDIGAGRDDACVGVRRLLSDGDGRVMRGRRVRSHLRGCGGCMAFAAEINSRERDLALAFPLGPALALFGGSAGAASLAGAGAVAGGGWSLGIGASVAVKCATVCAAAAILGAAAIEQHVAPAPGHHHRSATDQSLEVAALPSWHARRAPIVIPSSPRRPAQSSHRASQTQRIRTAPTSVRVSAVSSPRAVTAHLPAVHTVAKSVPSKSTDVAAAPVSAPAGGPAPASRQTAAFSLPQIAGQIITAAQQQAATAMQTAMGMAQTQIQQSIALAQQLTTRALSGFFHIGTTTSANAPASPTTP